MHVKHGTRCSGSQVHADLHSLHMSMKSINKMLGIGDVIYALAERFGCEMERLRSKRKLKLKKFDQLKKIVGTATILFDATVTKRGTKKEFEEGGAINKATGWYPGGTYLLRTCKSWDSKVDNALYELSWMPKNEETDFPNWVKMR